MPRKAAKAVPEEQKRMSLSGVAVGYTVLLDDGRSGIVKYKGNLTGKGIFLGIELESGYTGKNTGDFKGKKIFDCAPNQGVFVRFTKVISAQKPELGWITGLNFSTGTLNPCLRPRRPADDSTHAHKLFIADQNVKTFDMSIECPKGTRVIINGKSVFNEDVIQISKSDQKIEITEAVCMRGIELGTWDRVRTETAKTRINLVCSAPQDLKQRSMFIQDKFHNSIYELFLNRSDFSVPVIHLILAYNTISYDEFKEHNFFEWKDEQVLIDQCRHCWSKAWKRTKTQFVCNCCGLYLETQRKANVVEFALIRKECEAWYAKLTTGDSHHSAVGVLREFLRFPHERCQNRPEIVQKLAQIETKLKNARSARI